MFALVRARASRHPSKSYSIRGLNRAAGGNSFQNPAQSLSCPRPTSTMARQHADDFISFVNSSPTPFHAVKSAAEKLQKHGFERISEREPWSSKLKPGGLYYLTRNGSTLVAFAIGRKWKPGNPIAMVGAHTDSCCLRVKPVSKKQADGFLQVGVETYGGGLWHTWFDRDLSIAGKAMVRHNGAIVEKLVKVEKPILRIPSLAIHLDRQEPFQFSKEGHLFPIAGMAQAELNRQGKSAEDAKIDTETSTSETGPLKALNERHHSYIVDLIAKEAGTSPENILDFEVVLYDTQKSCIGGLNDELIFSARLDNLMMSFCAVEGLVESVSKGSALDDEESIRLIGLFDHEEIGSQSAQGADSNILPAMIRRLSVVHSNGSTSDDSYDHVAADASSTAYEESLIKSFMVSADMAHSVNPNYGEKYESNHRPEMNKGTVLKINANVRYATNSPGIVLLQEVAARAHAVSGATSKGVPLQLFVAKNDSPCGTTIGPMLSAALGTRTLDLGNAQLAMHSIRETCGAHDVEYAIKLFDSFFRHYSELEKTILVDQ